ncbi:hypothetical protein BpHYR1_006223 [Brachionus plicatilis]|uniref:Uncharacterized protein n=1 Tax=Brachionus plicatilis TaxID=10195 RepID=A0A3M7S8H0_BRAPC|nr:hypothetical protein BpHYR1_006223 [Brachionus plicatilis]
MAEKKNKSGLERTLPELSEPTTSGTPFQAPISLSASFTPNFNFESEHSKENVQNWTCPECLPLSFSQNQSKGYAVLLKKLFANFIE